MVAMQMAYENMIDFADLYLKPSELMLRAFSTINQEKLILNV